MLFYGYEALDVFLGIFNSTNRLVGQIYTLGACRFPFEGTIHPVSQFFLNSPTLNNFIKSGGCVNKRIKLDKKEFLFQRKFPFTSFDYRKMINMDIKVLISFETTVILKKSRKINTIK